VRDTSQRLFLVKNKFLETIKIEDGVVYNMPYHQQRFEEVLHFFLVYQAPLLVNLIKPPKIGLFRCRIVYDPKALDLIEILYIPYAKRAIKSFKIITDNAIEYSFKYVDRTDIDTLFAKKGDCDEILIVKNGLVCDTSIANIAFYIDGAWLTPKTPLLKGTARQRFLEQKKIKEIDMKVEDLSHVKYVALMNAMIDFDTLDSFHFHF
jgi:4-amino-4-deoxychorismate lyase